MTPTGILYQAGFADQLCQQRPQPKTINVERLLCPWAHGPGGTFDWQGHIVTLPVDPLPFDGVADKTIVFDLLLVACCFPMIPLL